jgi:threonine dehydratase
MAPAQKWPASGPAGPPVGVADVRAAAQLLRGVIEPSPMQGSRWLAEAVGGQVLCKCENLQRAGSFKVRGAYTRMSRLSADERSRGVVTASAGNHAQGVALAASLLGISATVFMPAGAALPKEEATRGYGADVVSGGASIDECLVSAREFAQDTGASLIHPFDHVDIVAGQGTVGLEILEQCPQVRTVVVPVGGGGLAAGLAVALRGSRPADEPSHRVRLVGVQAAAAAAYPASLASGHPVPLRESDTMADGIAVGRPGDVPFRVLSDPASGLDDLRTVSEESLSRAVLLTLERMKLVVEPAGAAGVATLLDDPTAFEPPVVVVLSGGNIDPLLLSRVIRHGLAASHRYLSITVRFSDHPGSLADVLSRAAASGANVLEVAHRRTAADLGVDQVEVSIDLETRGLGHCDLIVDSLREAGYRVHRTGDSS